MIPAVVVTALWMATVDPCAPIGSPLPADPAQAAVYLSIGDDEAARGDPETAAVAYREALRREPRNGRARARLARLCQATRQPSLGPERFNEGLALMKAGRARAAAAIFEGLRNDQHDSAATLLAGICFFDAGDDDRARPLLQEASAEPALADSARFFLGLIALRGDDQPRAAELFRSALASPNQELRAAARTMVRAAERQGRAVIAAGLDVGFDSNVALTPDGSTLVPSSRDGSAAATAVFSFRPWRGSGPALRAAGQYRQQFRLTDYDLGSVGAAAGWRQTGATAAASAEYGYDLLTLGSALYLSFHHVQADARLTTAALTFSAAYNVRWESYQQAATSSYSGVRQAAEGDAALRLGDGVTAACGYHGVHDDARDASLTYWEHGPSCQARIASNSGPRLTAGAGFSLRRYAAPETTGGATRSDRLYDGVVIVELDAATHWTWRLALSARRATSNGQDYAYTRFTAALGASYSLGVW